MSLVILAVGMGSRYEGLNQLDSMTKHGEFIIVFLFMTQKQQLSKKASKAGDKNGEKS